MMYYFICTIIIGCLFNMEACSKKGNLQNYSKISEGRNKLIAIFG